VPTTISNPASFSSVRTAFNAEGYGISNSFFAYRQGGGIVPATSGFNTIGAGTGGDPLQLTQFNGFTVPSPITFIPDGGTTAGTRVLLSDQGSLYASVTISCSAPAVWTWSGGQAASYVTVPSGGTDTSIVFEVSASPLGGWEFANFTVQATSGSITRYWSVELIAEDNS
jgi:hypothetical protein